jgi:hypothetical protein
MLFVHAFLTAQLYKICWRKFKFFRSNKNQYFSSKFINVSQISAYTIINFTNSVILYYVSYIYSNFARGIKNILFFSIKPNFLSVFWKAKTIFTFELLL